VTAGPRQRSDGPGGVPGRRDRVRNLFAPGLPRFPRVSGERGIVAWLCAVMVACTGPASARPPDDAAPSSGAIRPVAGEVTVFAASSLADAFREIGGQFQLSHPGSSVVFNFAASTQLATQLEQGAQADVYASADRVQMDRARASGRVEASEAVFARNGLVLVAPSANPGNVRGLADLARPGMKVLAAQADVPIGTYTQQMLDRASGDPVYGADFRDRVNANVVSREANVRQMVAKVQLGEADAAVVYRSDVTPQAASRLMVIEVPEPVDVVAAYPIALVRGAPNPAGGAAFVAMVLSAPGQGILSRWGFSPGAAAGSARDASADAGSALP